MIKGSQLENRGEIAGAAPVAEAAKDEAARRLGVLLERIGKARVTRDGEDQHCAECFRRGRDAALRIIDAP